MDRDAKLIYENYQTKVITEGKKGVCKKCGKPCFICKCKTDDKDKGKEKKGKSKKQKVEEAFAGKSAADLLEVLKKQNGRLFLEVVEAIDEPSADIGETAPDSGEGVPQKVEAPSHQHADGDVESLLALETSELIAKLREIKAGDPERIKGLIEMIQQRSPEKFEELKDVVLDEVETAPKTEPVESEEKM